MLAEMLLLFLMLGNDEELARLGAEGD